MVIKSIHKKIAIATLSLLATGAFCISSGISAVKADEQQLPIFGNYFLPDFNSKQEAWDNADKVNEEICEEGFTLLKNEDNCLPLAKGAKVSIFGKTSVDMLYGLSSNYVHLRAQDAPMVTLDSVLTDAGFNINPYLLNFYNDNTASGNGRGAQPTNGATVKGFNTGETPISMYTEDVEASYANYNDAALIVISRSSGEGWDLPKTMVTNSGGLINGARAKDDHYLQLDQNESDLMKYVGARFNKVIVIFDTPTTFETGFLDDPGHYGYHQNLKGAIWIGYTGRTGLKALGKILCGEVNPSGRTIDTWSRDYKLDPTWGNMGVFSISGGGVYVMYKEGIYVGYRYYETRGFEEGNQAYSSLKNSVNQIHGTTTENWDSWYHSAVCYPFGYGLSYTTFSEEIISTSIPSGTNLDKDDVLTVNVRVTNTGSVAGKRTSTIYYTAPYTSGGIEKPHVVLAGFAKTQILEPGASEDLAITFKVRDLAAYDYSDANHNGFKGYELEHGTYQIKLMSDAHTVIQTLTYNVATDQRVETSDATGYKIENQFDEVSTLLTNPVADGGLGESYLSRADFEGTFPTPAVTITLPANLRAQYNEYKNGYVPDDSTKKYYVESADIHFGDDTGDIKLCDLFRKDYDDPLWDSFLDEISESSMKYIISEGGYRSGKDIPALGITRVINAGQPAGYMSLFSGMAGAQYAFFSSDSVTAATYNEELAYKKGIAIGNEALFGTGKGKSRFPGWYAPAADTHRSPFGGRCADYFSEDGLVGGKLAAKIIEGATEKGVFTFFKHFALNEQENNRIQITTWASEQSMREIYLKPFEIAVKEGHTLAIMSALNRVGPTWSGGHYGLLQEVLRNEWGFNGAVVTDSYIGGFSMMDQMVKNGGDLALGSGSGTLGRLGSTSDGTMTPTSYMAIRNSVHHILYAMANSMAINTGYATPPDPITDYAGDTLPSALVNTSYSQSIATVGYNPDAFSDSPIPDISEITYSLKEGSTLPEGLTLGSDGMISGTPTEEVFGYSFTVIASYSTCKKEATFTLTVSDVNGSIVYRPVAGIRTLYINETVSSYDVATAAIEKRGATPEEIANFPKVTYSLEPGSYLPTGLTMNKEGVISGIPTRECMDYEFTVLASALGYRDVKCTFRLEVVYRNSFTSRELSNGKLNTPYLDKVAEDTPNTGFKYMLKTGSTLPTGLTLTPGGYITGTPKNTVKDYSFTVISYGNFSEQKEATFTISIGIKYNRVEAPVAHKGQEYYLDIGLAQGAEDITYSMKDGQMLPLYMDLSEDGKLTGVFKHSGTVTITVIAYSESLDSYDSVKIKILVED